MTEETNWSGVQPVAQKTAYDELEPATTKYDYEIAPLLSIAISLKRLADAWGKR